MAFYLWSGKDSSGRKVTERVDAANPEEAREQLLSRGWTNLELRSSEIHDFVKQEIDAVSDPECRPELTPEQEVAYLQGKGPGFWTNW